ncbi:uncharacterized protein LOC130642030 [Hydractinia symbiolongicarpus]|uniref:uncharacterized protein LOC130642030 n=1 Tax=Hydractinia symbiolongicarpus TaxID=13093 RepID=UPI00254FBB8C|nr:uncharacterized protein LOC130642030 [Hydractinia symbiolongicarpus]
MNKEIYLTFIVILTFNGHAYARDSDCPRPKVMKQTIIRSKESIKNGAILIGKEIVETARSCYDLCCSYETCNVALMHYKQVKNEIGDFETHKYCYLFACGSPSVCSFGNHNRYAVIQLEQQILTTLPPTQAPIIEEEERCPPGVPVAMCAENPCDVKSCPAHNDAKCKPNFCGGCNARFYNAENKLVNCSLPEYHVSALAADDHNEQSLTVTEGDYEETPTEDILLSSNSKKTDEQDPYFHSNRRQFITDPAEAAELFNSTTPGTQPPSVKVVIRNEPPNLKSIPLLIALIVSLLFIVGLIYHFKCAKRGKAKKFPVDDGDYLINGMYL